MDIEKMREQFEEVAMGHYLLCERSLQRDEHQLDEYLDPEVQVAWEFWQASRAVVVVELPAEDPLGNTPGDCEGGLPSFEQHCAAECNSVLADCRAAVESQGLKVAP